MDSPIRVVIEQPSLAKYRVPVFRELSNRPGIDLTVLYGETPEIPNVEPEGFRAEFVPMREWKFAGQTIRWHKAQWQAPAWEDVDVLIFSWNIRYLSLFPALLRAKWRRVPVVLWGHGCSKNDNRFRRFLRLIVTRFASATLLYDRDTARKLVESGLPAEKVFVAPNAIDQSPIEQAREAWLADPQRLERFRQENDLCDREVLLLVSRLVPNRRVDMLLRATAELLPQYPRILTIVIGDGVEEKQRLENLVEQVKLGNHVRFVNATYDEHSLAPWFLSASAFVCPSFLGLSLLHAFGYGLPTITSDALSQHGPEIIALRNGVNGMLYEANSLPSLTATIGHFLENHPLRNEMSAEALKTVRDEFTVNRMVDGFESAIKYCRRLSPSSLPGMQKLYSE